SSVKLWEISTLKEKAPLRSHAGATQALAFSGDGQRLASGGRDGLVKIWEPSSASEKTTLVPHRGQVNSVSYALDGKLVAAGSWASETGLKGKTIDVGEVKLWEIPGYRERANLRSIHRHAVTAVALAANGKLGA